MASIDLETRDGRVVMARHRLRSVLVLSLLDLAPVERSTAALATELAAVHGLKATDAIHLATAIEAGADRFVTNNSRDFSEVIEEIDIVDPSDLADPEDPTT